MTICHRVKRLLAGRHYWLDPSGGTVYKTGADSMGVSDDKIVTTVRGSEAPRTTVKWNPGHYIVSDSWYDSASDWTAKIKPEIDTVLADATVLGWVMMIHWGKIETGAQGVRDWSLIDNARSYIATNYPTKRFGLQIQCDEFGSPAGNPVGAVPNYILTDPAYGAGYQYDANHYYYGYWPMAYGSTAAWWIPAVADRIKALFAALASHTSPFASGYTYDTDPYVEVITSIAESSTSLWNPPDNTGYTTANGTYSAAAAKTQWEGIIKSMVASFPHTNIADMNNFFAYTGVTDVYTAQVGLDDMQARAAASGPDVVGGGTAPNYHFSWGQQGYMGLLPGFTSMFQKAPYFSIVEQPDYGKYGCTLQQIADACLRNPSQNPPGLGSSHVFWTPLNWAGSGAQWATDLKPMILANPVPDANKVYPSLYGQMIKWNPGHYVASGDVGTGATLSDVQAALTQCVGLNNVQGIRVLVSWSTIEPSYNVYDFSFIDAVIAWMKANMVHAQIVVCIKPGSFAGKFYRYTNNSIAPDYLMQNPGTYGAAPFTHDTNGNAIGPGSAAWGAIDANGAGTGGWAINICNNNVLSRLIALCAALGNRYDSNPNFEGLMFQETAWWESNISAGGGAPGYSGANFVAAQQALFAGILPYFPHTTIINENTWTRTATECQTLANWMFSNRVVPGSADTIGHSAFANLGYAQSGPSGGLCWGLQALFGIQATGSSAPVTDKRGTVRAMLDVEPPDISGNYFNKWGAPHGFTPLDVIAAANQDYKASHLFWAWMQPGDGVRPYTGDTVQSSCPWASWVACGGYPGVGATVNDPANALTNVGYPGNYP